MTPKFYKCPHCGNVIAMLVDSGVVPVCCGQPMKPLDARTQDGAREKHLPVVEMREGGHLYAKVGEVLHPMQEEHHIVFIAAQTQQGLHFRHLASGDVPEALFSLGEEKPVAVYEYCNLHGLWKTVCDA
ncbi:MAG: desulfoferrodoxin [Bacteroidales bacterium]|nr:desulfoferrodoxin [Candidatus Equimonas enterica]